jgi:redox-sensitive bicupin YhaK (pirin superfamily)
VQRGDTVIAPGDWARTDPFLLLSEDWFSEIGFTWHPHRGFETVTLVIEGAAEHGDNAGHSGVLQTGDVQWMTAGSGIVHKEVAHGPLPLHTLQLWVNLPAALKGVEPAYQDLRRDDVPTWTADGVAVRIFAGTHDGLTAATRTRHPETMLDIEIDQGAGVEVDVPPAHRAFGYVLGGAVRIGGVGGAQTEVAAGNTFWFDPVADPTSTVRIAAASPSRVIFMHGLPIGEPVVAGYRRRGGSFVMNTQDEVQQAFEDFGAGRFGATPGPVPGT